jgi:LuxR family maltose regulon positive regulatory protein
MATVALDQALLDAKLSVPQSLPHSVSRAPLIETARASDCRVVGVTAPPGYGKSTLLVEWAQAEDRRVAWMSLDRLDDDPGALLTLLASAYARVSSGNADLVADMGGLGVSVLGRAAPQLAAAFRTSPVPFVLMLDDLQELKLPACHDVLGVVIAGIPRGSQLVSASRSEQPHLPRLRASGDALEFLASNLTLDAAGAEQIFSDVDVSLTPEMAVAVTEQTEGWPVGLYLAALIARDSQGESLSVAGDDRYVADYLYRESLLQQPESVQRFLRRTAVLDQLSAPLCEALLGESGAQEQLRTLEASNLFLVPLDRRRGWYRYHALFREFLLSELRRVEPDLIEKLNLRAADWYEANGSPSMAVEHLLQTSERDRCLQVVTAVALPMYKSGHISTVHRWFTELGEGAIQSSPPLAVLAGWITSLSGDVVSAQRWAAIVDAASYELVPLDGSASFDSGRAMWRAFICPVGPELMLLDAKLALEQEPPWSVWRDNTLVIAGEAFLLSGDVDRAVELFTESSALSAVNSNTDSLVLSESELALLAMDRGQWSEAAEHLERAQTTIDEHRLHDYATCLLAFAAAARLAVQRGDLKKAELELTRAMRARVSLTFVLSWLSVRVRLQLAKVYSALGEQTTARHLLREIDDVMLQRPRLGILVEEVAELRQLLTASTQGRTAGGSPLSPAELRLLPYLQTHLTYREIAERLFVSRNTVSTEVSSIFRKLGASSRGEAVQQATSIGLLGG